MPGLAHWVKEPVLLWLWCRLAARAQIGPLAWEPLYAGSAALKRPKKKRIIFGVKVKMKILSPLFKRCTGRMCHTCSLGRVCLSLWLHP